MPELTVVAVTVMTGLVAVIVQFIVWRVRMPAHHTKAIVCIFAATYIAAVIASVAWAGSPMPRSAAAYAQSLFVFLILVACYVITYTAIEADSPTMIVIDRATAAGETGATRASLEEGLTDDALIWTRVDDLLADGLIRSDNDRYRLSPRGQGLVRVFMLQRRLLGLGKGG